MQEESVFDDLLVEPDTLQFSQGNSDDTESLVLTVSDFGSIAFTTIPIGFLSGAIIMIIGFTLLGIVKIFKQV